MMSQVWIQVNGIRAGEFPGLQESTAVVGVGYGKFQVVLKFQERDFLFRISQFYRLYQFLWV